MYVSISLRARKVQVVMSLLNIEDKKNSLKFFLFRSLEASPRGQRQASSGSGSGRIGLMSRNMNGTSKSMVSIPLSISPTSVNQDKMGLSKNPFVC